MAKTGTEWSIWDLHVHTPASIHQHYAGDNESSWEKFFSDIENLDENFKVIGINDYWILDGYERVLRAHNEGRMSNIELFLPVIEMRLSHFGGSKNSLSRVNLHVIFNNTLAPGQIRNQFLSRIESKYKLSPNNTEEQWNAVIDKDSIIDLGKQIKAQVPSEKLVDYGSDLQEGFNNLNTTLKSVEEALDNSFLRGNYLLGIGKSEWSSIKWNGQSIAEKKNLINTSDFIFSAYIDNSNWANEVESFKRHNITHKILDCSDAHYNAESSESMRIGNCSTWINTITTFEGLKYALSEFDRRVFVGSLPKSIRKIRESPNQFINKIEIKSDNPDLELFNHNLKLNPGFVAIVGNKGQGKSALLDCIALAGNSNRNSDFAFLNKKRFLSPHSKSKADRYTAKLTWKNGIERSVALNEEFDTSTEVKVEYLPQMFVERVCNYQVTEAEAFESELKNILFTHIKTQDRENKSDFDELLESKTKVFQERISSLRGNLLKIIDDYQKNVSFKWDNKETDLSSILNTKKADLKNINQSISELKNEISVLSNSTDTNQSDISNNVSSKISDISKTVSQIKEKIESKKKLKLEYIHNISTSKERLTSMTAFAERLVKIENQVHKINTDYQEISDSSENIAYIEIKNEVINSLIEKTKKATDALEKKVYEINAEMDELEIRLNTQENQLRMLDGERQAKIEDLNLLENRKDLIIGSKQQPGSIKEIEGRLLRLESIPGTLSKIEKDLINISSEIHHTIRQQSEFVKSLYQPAAEYIEGIPILSDIGLEFSTEIVSKNIWDTLLGLINKNKSSLFEEWASEIYENLDVSDFNNINLVLRELITRINSFRGDGGGDSRDPRDVFNRGTSLSDFLMTILNLDWLGVRFGITGHGLPLSHLSPGQRGLILTMFYLVVDLRNTPLLLDQPEENLDNETIASNLVPALHFASGRRQTIVVTHNANLAIVGDADQIIHCHSDGQRFYIDSGCIAEFNIADTSINILEGTRTAFDNRRIKYDKFV
ncbi:TrlF family AAA-like ATPase [Rothia endophytica]|uniref:AAA family ATPase n=1 Tax=Rothia endophytica TaxID=1324766 RepID=A0ABP9B5P3_9MICC